MTFIEHAVVLRAPLNLVYTQWRQVEAYPQFMQGIDSVQRLQANTLIWAGDFFGEFRVWYTEGGTHIPNQLITWHTVTGPKQNVVVRFGYIDAETTRLTMQTIFEPSDFLSPETAASTVSRRIVDDLRRFKMFIEAQGAHEYAYQMVEELVLR